MAVFFKNFNKGVAALCYSSTRNEGVSPFPEKNTTRYL